jgi:hypothetical protein
MAKLENQVTVTSQTLTDTNGTLTVHQSTQLALIQ